MSLEICSKSELEINVGEDEKSDVNSEELIRKTVGVGVQVNARKTTLDIEFSDPGKLMLLYNTLYNVCSLEIQKKINSYLQHVTKSDISFIIQNPCSSLDAYITVLGMKEVFPEIRIKGYHLIIERPCSIELPIVFEEDEIPPQLLSELSLVLYAEYDHEFKRLMLIPVIHPITLKTILLVGLVNFQEGPNCKYVCEGLVSECFRFCLGTVLNTLYYAEEREHHKRCKSLLNAIRQIFMNVENTLGLFDVIREVTRNIALAERCNIYLADGSGYLVSKILGYGASIDISKGMIKEVRIPFGESIPGVVGTTGRIFNCPDVKTEAAYIHVLDKAEERTTRNILAFPVTYNFNLIGVLELQNKLFGEYFTYDDEEYVTALSVFLSHAITQGLTHKRLMEAANRRAIANKIILHQLKFTNIDDDFETVYECEDEHDYEDLTDFRFTPNTIPEKHTVCLCLKIFIDLGIQSKFRIDLKKLTTFLVYTRRCCNKVPGHNWYHAFGTFHFVFLILNNINLVENDYLTLIEAFALLIAALVHDLDYNAPTLQFGQLPVEIAQASLYGSPGSMAQHYHVSQAMTLLTTLESSIAENLDNEEYEIFINLVAKMILATDIWQFTKNTQLYEEMIVAGYDKNDPFHRQNLHSLIMTCANLSDYSKHWVHCKDVADTTFRYFSYQNEFINVRSSYDDQPEFKPDINKIPYLQIHFMEQFCTLPFRFLAHLFPVVNNCLERIEENIENWKKLRDTLQTGETLEQDEDEDED